MLTTRHISYLCSCLLASLATLVAAQDFPAEQIEFFEKEIRPVLVESCLDCHTGQTAKSGLQLDHREGWLRGTDYAKIVDLEKPAASLVLAAIRHTGKAKAMPKTGDKLSDHEVAAIERWITMGLPWPEEQSDRPARVDRRQHWSFQPVESPELPEGAGHPIDYFIRKKLAEAGIEPAPQASPATVYRRLSYDLIGLPPTYEEIQAYAAAETPDLAAQIDQLMASPHYGERWARHWMDVARYSDTKGYEAANRARDFLHSHTYRDWLIRAFNEDMPFDQFLIYQLAAEQVVEDWDGPDRHHLAAMGFLSLSKNGAAELVLDDRVDTTFRGMMGLTVSCARCHDHKSDPISTREYYSLYKIFRNSNDLQKHPIAEAPDTPEYKKYQAELTALEKKRSDYLEPFLNRVRKENPKIRKDDIPALIRKLSADERKRQRNMLDDVNRFIAKAKMEADHALFFKERTKHMPQHVYIRGNPGRRGELVPAQFLQLAAAEAPAEFSEGSSRLQLAHSIASAENPLTARVIVNRVWMWHFGEGLVRTVSDFGLTGEPPSHPELLDWLADWFIKEGWSIQALHRLILTSQTWQQSSDHPQAEAAMLIDPENRLLWRAFKKRLDFEQMRDAMLTVSGELDRSQYGRSVKMLEAPYSQRRTVYAYIDRQNLPAVFRHFDFSNPAETTGKRPDTTIPMQALFTMNSDFAMDRASALVERVAESEDRVGQLHRLALGREPSEQDRILADSFIGSYDSDEHPDDTQNLSGWAYGWGHVDTSAEPAQVTFRPFRHWEPKAREYRIKKEYPIKDGPLSYLRINPNILHPGHTAKQCVIIRWQAPRDMTIRISSLLERPAIGKGSGVLGRIVSDRQGLLLDRHLLPEAASIEIGLDTLEVDRGEQIHFILDPRENNCAHDNCKWAPIIVNAHNAAERWTMSLDIDKPQKPIGSWQAYAQALLNTNRFLFVE